MAGNNLKKGKRHFLPYVIFFLFLLIIQSCTLVVRTLYGVTDPKIENKESLVKFLNKKELDTSNIYCVSFEEFKPTLELSKNKIPDVLIFNKNGEYIPYGEEWACNASAFNFIKELNNDTLFQTNDLITLDSLLTKFRDFDGNKLNSQDILEIKNADFICVAIWAKFTGKLNKTKVKEWEKQARENNNTKIKFIKLNVDLQEWWGISEDDLFL